MSHARLGHAATLHGAVRAGENLSNLHRFAPQPSNETPFVLLEARLQAAKNMMATHHLPVSDMQFLNGQQKGTQFPFPISHLVFCGALLGVRAPVQLSQQSGYETCC